MTKLCQVCFRPYNYVLKSEAIQTEEMYLWAKLDVAFNYDRTRCSQTWENTELYLEQLSHTQIAQLFEMYHSDFKAFGYVYVSPYVKNGTS